jgi:hypothetical protein
MTGPDMAKPDAAVPGSREEGDLAIFFDAARAAEPGPSMAFLNAVLADAASVAAARAASVQAVPARRRGRRLDLAGWLRPLGGWVGATALAGCAALGFVAGALGTGAGLAEPFLAPEAASLDLASESVTLFFDLGAAEG